MKKFFSFVLALIMLISLAAIIGTAVSEPRESILSYETPTAASQAKLRFSVSLGSGYQNAPTPPIVVNETLIVLSGSAIYKLDADSGKVLAKATMKGSVSFSCVSPTYYNGVIYAALNGGIVQAFSYDTLESLWVYTDSLGGQSLSPITYSGGYVYTGFWNGEEKYANYVCISVKDENTKKTDEAKKAVWTYKNLGGYYWAGAAITTNFAVFGCDNGKSDSTSNSKLIAVNKKTGKLADTITVKGDVRSSITYSTEQKAYYTASKAGYVYRFKLNSSTGVFSSLKYYKASGDVTSTPVVYSGRVYVGAQNGKAGQLAVLDAATLKEIYHADTEGYPQSTVTVSDGYFNDTGKIYVYATCNSKTGSIVMLEDSVGQTSPKLTTLFTPSEDKQQYCISTISVGADGTLYYKNDSGYIFAVEKKTSSFNILLIPIYAVALFIKILQLLGFLK